MYNPEMKEGFCKDYLKSRIISKTSLYGFFNKIEQYEEKLNKDVVNFSREEALDMYRWIGSRSVYTLMNNNTILKSYYAWKKHYYNVNNENVFDGIIIEDLRKCVDKNKNKLLTREEIIEIEDQLLNDSDKAIVELLFVGVAGKNMEDIYVVSEECVKGNKLIVNGKQFDMTPRLKELLPKAFDETEIMAYGETMKIFPVKGKGRIYKERCNTKGIDTDDARFRYFYRRIQLFRNYLGIEALTMKSIAAAGLMFTLNNGTKKSGLDLKSFLRTDEGEEIANRYGFSGDYYIDNIYAKYKQYL